jgi:hypothetical protein
MIRIEPKQLSFLETKPKSLQCKLPPVENYLELVNMVYLDTDTTYVTSTYNLECHIVATGDIMYHDFLKSTEVKTMYIVKTTKDFYFMLSLAELRRYLTEVKETKSVVAC